MKTFNSIEDLKPYYNENTDTYEFIEDDVRIDVEFKFHLRVASNIDARDINAWDIKAWDINSGDINSGDINALNIKAGDINAGDINAGDINAGDIKAWNIKAWDIKAGDINYYAVCFAYKNITCTSIKGGLRNSKHFVLDGKTVIEPKEEKKPVTLELTDVQLAKIKEMLGKEK